MQETPGHSLEDKDRQGPLELRREPQRTSVREMLLLLAMTAGAVVLHGYHGGAEDAEVYLPGVLKNLNPALYPRNSEFFGSHAGMTLYPVLVAGSIRLSHLPTATVMLLWHLATIFGFLFACFRIARLCFSEKHAVWCGVALTASLLTLPVAGTALYIMDPYVTTRSFSTAASMLALASILERRYAAGAGWVVLTMAVHPLMSLFLLALAGMLVLFQSARTLAPFMFAVFPLSLFPPVSHLYIYRVVLQTHRYFLITNWAWYEWLGMLAPLVMLLAMATAGRRACGGPMAHVLKVVAAFEAFFIVAALLISVPGPLERFAEIQPMRSLLLVYILLFLFGGCLLGEWVLRRRVWRWALLFAPLCAGMAVAQVQLYPDSRHLEFPWLQPRNSWVEAFDWIRGHTPEDAYFALDPDYKHLPGEDEHGFRAISQRSMVADNWNDAGVVSMFPALAPEWSEQVESLRGWKQFQRPDFLKLKARYGVDWVLLQRPGASGLVCPYQNERLVVCRVD
jgi:hypothetical protein